MKQSPPQYRKSNVVTRLAILQHILNVRKEIKKRKPRTPEREINSPGSWHLVNQKVTKFELGKQT